MFAGAGVSYYSHGMLIRQLLLKDHNMIKKLLIHHWKSYWRSPEKGQNLTTAIVTGLSFLILSGYGFAAGFYLPDLLKKIAPHESPTALLNTGVLYITSVWFLLRLFLQGIPSQAVDYYRMLPVKRSTLIWTLLLKSLASPFNMVAFFFYAPFAFKGVLSEYPLTPAICWFLTVISIELSSNYFMLYVKKRIFSKPTLILPFILILIVSLVFEFIASKSTGYYSGLLIGSVIINPFVVAIPVLVLGGLVILNYRSLDNNFYPDDLVIGRKENIRSYSRYGFLENFGEIGSYVALELKMIFRNKRPRTLFYYSFIFFIYPLMIYKNYFAPTYPLPDKTKNIIEKSDGKNNNSSRVTFIINSSAVPKSANVFVYGKNENLGGGNVDEVNLFQETDHRWSRSFQFRNGEVIDYSFCLGAPKSNAADSNGIPLIKNFLAVRSDTVIELNIQRWQVPLQKGQMGFLLVFWVVFLMSYGGAMYGEYLYSWEGGYFDLLLSRKINKEKYIETKFVIMVATSVLAFIIMIPYAFFGIQVLWFNLAGAIYAAGVNFILFILLGNYNRRRMDLNSNRMSMQGRDGWGQSFKSLPIMVLMGIIYLFMMLLKLLDYVFYVYTLVGMIGLILHRKLIKVAIIQFDKQRYKMSAGFRQN